MSSKTENWVWSVIGTDNKKAKWALIYRFVGRVMQNCFDPAIISLSIVWKPLQNDSYFLVCGLDGVKSLPQLTTSVISWNEELVRKFGFTCPGVRFSWQAAAAGVFMALFFGPNPERYIRVYNEFLLLFWNISWRLVGVMSSPQRYLGVCHEGGKGGLRL